MKKKNGFSLIETLVVIAVISIMGVMLADLLTRTIEGGNKTQLIGNIKDNGQSVLNIMDSTIRDADTIICPLAGPSDTLYTQAKADIGGGNIAILPYVLVVVKNGVYTRFGLVPQAGVQNGYISEDNPVVCAGGTCNDPTLPENILGLCTQVPPQATAKILTDSKVVTVPASPQSIFTRSHSPGFKDTVSLQFYLSPATIGKKSTDQVGTNNLIPFSDTIELE